MTQFHTACAVGYSLPPLPGLVAHVSAVLAYRYARICSIGAHFGGSLTSLSHARFQANGCKAEKIIVG